MKFWLVVHQSQKSILYMLLTLVMHPLLECSFLPRENGHIGVDVTIIALRLSVLLSYLCSCLGISLTCLSFTFVLQQIENVFEQLISKIEPADFDPRPFLKQLNVLGRYEPIKRSILTN